MNRTTRFQQGDKVEHNGRPARILWVQTWENEPTRYAIEYTDGEGGSAGFPQGLLGRVLRDR